MSVCLTLVHLETAKEMQAAAIDCRRAYRTFCRPVARKKFSQPMLSAQYIAPENECVCPRDRLNSPAMILGMRVYFVYRAKPPSAFHGAAYDEPPPARGVPVSCAQHPHLGRDTCSEALRAIPISRSGFDQVASSTLAQC